jgi:virginiamycin B lyase
MKALFLAALIATPALAEPVEKVIPVPGFADFIAVDGATVWTTNRGRVEHWSADKKLAEVASPHPCGGMSIAHGALWFADCKEGVVKRVSLRGGKVIATIPTGLANGKEGELNVAAGAGSIWVASDAKGEIKRIDAKTNKVIATIPTEAQHRGSDLCGDRPHNAGHPRPRRAIGGQRGPALRADGGLDHRA